MPEPTAAPSMSPEQAEILLKANYRNLVKKVQAGRTLSAGELNLLQAIQTGGQHSSSRRRAWIHNPGVYPDHPCCR